MGIVLAAAALIVALVALAVAVASAARLRAVTTQGTLGTTSTTYAPLPEHNAEIADFTAQLRDGGSFSRADLAGEGQLIGFFTTNCQSCKAELPYFLTAAEQIPSGGPTPVAVLSGGDDEVVEMATLFPAEVSVVIEPPDFAVSHGAGIRAYPTFLVADHGRVRTAAVRMDRLFAHT